MSRSLVRGLFAILVVALSAPTQALTLVPTELRSYRVLPRFSTVLETGGFAGVANRYRVRGGFDVSFGAVAVGLPILGDPLPSGIRPVVGEELRLEFRSEFVEAELWGTPISDGPVIAKVLDVDEAFNLTGLEGERVPTLNPGFDLYQYSGETRDGSAVRLFGAVAGRWFFLAGGTTAPPGSADFFEYRIRSLARLAPFDDPNGDAVVNAADYTVLRDSGGGLEDWAAGFGVDAPDLSVFDWLEADFEVATAPAAVAVPEPATTITLLGLALAGLARGRCRRV